MMSSYDVKVKNLTSTIRLQLSTSVFNITSSMEYPIQKFYGHDNYDWKFRMFCSSGTLVFRQRSVHGFTCPDVSIKVEGTDYRNRMSVCSDNTYWNAQKWYGGEGIRMKDVLIKKGKFTVIITATIRVPYSVPLHMLKCEKTSKVATKLSFNVGQWLTKNPDFKFLFVDDQSGKDQSLSVHKECFSNWSPVFKAMLEHDTQEARNGTLEIEDFDYDTVKAAVDLLYGHPFEPKPISEVVGMLRFVEKYLIKPAVDLLENWLITHITEDDFDAVVKYAFEHDSKKLKTVCAQCYYKHIKPGLREIDPAIISELVHLAANQA